MLGDQLHNGFRVGLIILLRQRQRIPHPKLILQIQARPNTPKHALIHNANPIAKVVRLIHEMGGQDDHPALLVFADHLPNESSGIGVHSGSGLI